MTAALKQLQQSFFGHLIGEQTDAVTHIKSSPDRTAAQRLHIYASGYRLRLKEAISTDFDKLFSYLGDELFEQLMDEYIDRYQSKHPSLRYYSQHICELLASQKPFSDYSELLEMAQIEQAFNHSFDAADCDTITLDSIAQVAPEAWAELSIKFHASLTVLPMQKNTFEIWTALSDDQQPPSSVVDAAHWMIWRKDLISRYRALSDAENTILSLAIRGANFTQLCEAAVDYCEEDQAAVQVIGLLQNWINEQLVCQLV